MTCGPSRFPDPCDAPGDAPLARGGDLEPETLLDAYRHGIFPWPTGAGRLYWWSPDPRAVFPDGQVRVSRSLRRTLRSARLRTTVDHAFDAVVSACAWRPREGTWITPAIASAYGRLHSLGHAHSVEVWDAQGRLVGGLYGVVVGATFSGESMFHRVADASKVALVTLAERLDDAGFALLDAQIPTPHLDTLGAVSVPRADFLRRLAALRDEPVRFPS